MQRLRHLDITGSALLALGVVPLCMGLIWGKLSSILGFRPMTSQWENVLTCFDIVSLPFYLRWK
jgi:hypothetical protein